MKKMWIWLISTVLVLLLGFSACSSVQGKTPLAGESNAGASKTVGSGSSGVQETPLVSIPPGTQTPLSTTSPTAGATETKNENATNGEQIYFRAVDQQRNNISYTDGPTFGGMMMGTYLTCAACHGPEAHGGKHVMMHMQVMDAPPIYYAGLVEMAQKDARLC